MYKLKMNYRIVVVACFLGFLTHLLLFGCGESPRSDEAKKKEVNKKEKEQENETVGSSDYYHLKKVAGTWWFVDPQGAPFVSIGINHIEPVLISSERNREVFKEKYGEDMYGPNGLAKPNSQAVKAWLDDSIETVQSWGFNSLGVHNPVRQKTLPYVAKFRPTKIDGWSGVNRRYMDPFASETAGYVGQKAQEWCAKNADDRMILGLSFNDMPRWRVEPGTIHPWVQYIVKLDGNSPGKQRWTSYLKELYPSPEEAGKVYGIKATSWDDFANNQEWPMPPAPEKAFVDSRDFLPLIADRWFKLLVESVRSCDSNHLILGDKFEGKHDLPHWLDPIIGKYFDAAYIQWYEYAESQIPRLRELYRKSGKPVLMGDSSFSFPNQEVLKPKGVRVGSQAAVGKAYTNYLALLMAEPYAVGWHHCGFMEGSPDLARVHRYFTIQNGFLKPDGTPHKETIELVTGANSKAHGWHAKARKVPPESSQATAKPAPKKTNGSRCLQKKEGGIVGTQVDDNIFVAGHFKGVGSPAPKKNISWVVTDEGIVVIDTGSAATARIVKKLIRMTSDKPIKYIIYTHHHGTQVGGAHVLRGPQTKVIAHRDTVLEFNLAHELFANVLLLNSIQFDFTPRPDVKPREFVYPDITYTSDYNFTLGGVRFELEHVVGEADDYTLVSVPEQRVVWVADLLSSGMPMVASPMKRVRDDVKWRLALERIREMKPQVVIDSVHMPACRQEVIVPLLDIQIEFLQFLHDSIVRELNAGSSVDEALENIELPEHLASSPVLVEKYSRLSFNVRGLYHRYQGWFDKNGTNIDPVKKRDRAKSFIEQMGGAKHVLSFAQDLVGQSQDELALEYLDLLIEVGSQKKVAHQLKAEILFRLGEKQDHRITAKMYHRLSTIEKKRADEESRNKEAAYDR
jgi:glyoxylase-like metal-dependent hydrolase (beta-lactamase superfamily II)